MGAKMTPLTTKDLQKLLREEIGRAGSQVQWARQMGVDRVAINRVLSGRALPTARACSALKLSWVVVRLSSEPVEISDREIIHILQEQINKAGSICSWSRSTGVDRTHVSKVLHGKRKSLGRRLLSILGLSEVLVRANDARKLSGQRRYAPR
jgi:DNA-binding phage protein